MDEVEQLFIRACKSNNPKVRLVSVLRRFYCGNVKTLDRHATLGLILHLSEIVDKYTPMKSLEIIDVLSRTDFWLEDNRDIVDKSLDMLIGRVQCTKKTVFVGMSTPRRFKN